MYPFRKETKDHLSFPRQGCYKQAPNICEVDDLAMEWPSNSSVMFSAEQGHNSPDGILKTR